PPTSPLFPYTTLFRSFSLFAILNNTEDADLKDESPLLNLYSPKQKEDRSRLQAEIAAIEKQFKSPTPESLASQTQWEQNFPRQRSEEHTSELQSLRHL